MSTIVEQLKAHGVPDELASELSKRHDAYPELVAKLNELFDATDELDGMLDGDSDKLREWKKEIKRIDKARASAKAVLATLNSQ